MATLIANANIVADKDIYTGKTQGEIIYDVSEGKFYGNHAADGDPPDWQDLGGSANGTGTDSTSFTLNQDNIGAGVNAAFIVNRGTSGTARLLWSETNTMWSCDADGAYCPFRASRIYLNASTYIYVDTSGNLVFHSGKGIMFE